MYKKIIMGILIFGLFLVGCANPENDVAFKDEENPEENIEMVEETEDINEEEGSVEEKQKIKVQDYRLEANEEIIQNKLEKMQNLLINSKKNESYASLSQLKNIYKEVYKGSSFSIERKHPYELALFLHYNARNSKIIKIVSTKNLTEENISEVLTDEIINNLRQKFKVEISENQINFFEEENVFLTLDFVVSGQSYKIEGLN